MKRFLKKHKFTIVLLLIFILLSFLIIKVKDILIPDEGKASYGDRLKDIEKHPISKEVYSKIEEYLSGNKKILKSSHRIQGKILNYYITVDDGVTVKEAKEIGDKLIPLIDEDTLNFYSIQLFISKDDKTLNEFPIIGLKDPQAKIVSWTKDRERQKIESEKNEE